MGKIAIVFSGQGAQTAGMGRELYETYPSVKKIFETAEKLRHGTIKQCFEGTAEELSQTINTQPCLFTVDIASAQALKENGIIAEGVAGFSLGELAGIVYSKMLNFEDGFNLVCRRAEIMHTEAIKKGGCMAAVIKIGCKTIEILCNDIGNIYPVNYNCEGQTVVAGGEKELEILNQKITALGGRIIKLPVSGAFHSPYMEEAYSLFKKETVKYNFKKSEIPLYSNVTAKPYDYNYAEFLALQVKSPVLWQKTIENMIGSGFDTFIEAGTGKTLTNLIKRISDNVKVFNAENNESLKAVLAAGIRI